MLNNTTKPAKNKLSLSCKKINLGRKSRYSSGFTIVELLVVIVVIGILAAITIVSYAGISQRAIAASLQSDLASAKKQLQVYQAENDEYPGLINDCPTPAEDNLCIPNSTGNNFINYSANNTTNPPTFTLDAYNGDTVYRVTNDSVPVAVAEDPDWITIGTQVWAKYNLNVGTRINGVIEQTNNGGTNTVEKYCYGDNESNCTTYGGLYLWDEAMQYVTTEGAQGICPAGSHIPSDNDWKILEMYLGMTQVQADAIGWRGTDQGTQLKPGGTSGLNVPLGGYRNAVGSFYNQSSSAYLWSSAESSTSSWRRFLGSGTTVFRNAYEEADGFSVRCLEN